MELQTAEPAELAEPVEPREMTVFIAIAFGGIWITWEKYVTISCNDEIYIDIC